jgi:hypothetical protein
MNTNLQHKNGTWKNISMPRVYRSVRGTSQRFSGNTFHHIFQMPIDANDILIGKRVMIKYHVSLHNVSWSDSRVVYAKVTGPMSPIPDTHDEAGHRFSTAEYTPEDSFTNGGNARRSYFHGTLCGTVTGSGTLSLRFYVDDSGWWEFRDDSQEQSRAI